MKSPWKRAAVNTRRASGTNMKFEKFLHDLPRADNGFNDAARPHTETVHLFPVMDTVPLVLSVDPLVAKGGARSFCKARQSPHQTHTFLNALFSQIKKFPHNPPPLGDEFWCIGAKGEKSRKKC